MAFRLPLLKLLYEVMLFYATLPLVIFFGSIKFYLFGGKKQMSKLAAQFPALTSATVETVGAKSEFVQVNGVRLHVVRAGEESGEMVLLLHGFPENWHTWRDQIPHLAKEGFFVIAPDMRGFGMSDKPAAVRHYMLPILCADVRELIEHYGRKSAFIVGHDWGACVAYTFAALYPDFTKAVVIANGVPFHVFNYLFRTCAAQWLRSWYIFFFQLPVLPELVMRLTLSTLPASMYRYLRRPASYSDSDKMYVQASLSQPGAFTGGINYYRAGMRYRQRLPMVDRPLLLIWGQEDAYIEPPVRWAHVLRKFAPATEIATIDASHWSPPDGGEAFTTPLISFIRKHMQKQN